MRPVALLRIRDTLWIANLVGDTLAIAFDGRNIWVANFGSDSVSTTLTPC